MEVDHIGYAVKKIDSAKDSFEKLGFTFEGKIEDKRRNIIIQFGEKDGYRIELVAPLDKSIDSPVDTFLSKVGPSTYHICYKSKELMKDVELLQASGYKVIIPPTPAIALDDKKVVFLMNVNIGLIEIVEG